MSHNSFAYTFNHIIVSRHGGEDDDYEGITQD